MIESALNGLSKLGALAGGWKDSALQKNAMSNGELYAWARISREYLARQVEREFDRERPARDRILGITFLGTSRTNGNTRLVLLASEDGAAAEVLFAGNIESRTTGHSGPATLYYLSKSTFRASKQVLISASGLRTRPAQAVAPTRLTPTQISTSLPRLRGRIAQRIAWRRAAQSQAEADAIASAHRAQDIREGLDQRLDGTVASVDKWVEAELAELTPDQKEKGLTIRSRSTPEYVELALLPPESDKKEFRMPEFEVADNADVSIRVHRSLAAAVMTNAQSRDKFAALAGGLVQGRIDDAQETERIDDRPSTKLEMGSKWVAFDLLKPPPEESEVRVASSGDEEQRRK